jgi:hypothetical protein
MAGRHRRRALAAQVAAQRAAPPVRIVDARTHLEHLVPGDVLAPHRPSFVAKCGAAVVAASLVEPGRGRCRECAL